MNDVHVGASGPLRFASGIFDRAPLRRDAAALAIFFALTCVMTNPLVFHLAGAVEDKQDALLNTWIIAWVGHTLITDPLRLFDTNVFYPYSNTLAFSERLLPQGLFALPFNLAFDNTVLGYNLVLLASFFLAAYAMYLFVFDLTRQRGAAILAGTIFAFNPFNLGNLAQVQLLSFGWLPLAMMYLRRLLKTTEHRQQTSDIFGLNYDLRISFLFALFFSLQSLSSSYYAFLAGFTVALYAAWFFAARWMDHRSTLPRSSASLLPTFIHLALASVLIAIFLIPFFLPYLSVQRELGFERKIEDSEPFSASLKLYTEVSPQNILYGSLLAPRPPIIIGGYPLDNLFPGFIALALAAMGMVRAKNRARWFYVLLLALAFIFSLGPRLFITPTLGTAIPLPYRWLYDALPLMRALRAPVRFDALVMFALTVLASFGAEKALGRTQKAENKGVLPTAFRLLPSLLVLFIALEYLAVPSATITPVPVGDAIPRYVRWLATQPPGVVLELPMIASDPSKPLDLTTQYLTTYHWRKTPDGYSGFIPPKRGEIAYEMQFFPNERAISLLQALAVQYVVVHSNQLQDWNERRDLITRSTDLQPAQQFGDDYIYRVASRAQTASALSARVYLPQPAAPSQAYSAYVIVQNRGTRSFAIKPTDSLQVDARWSDGATITDQHAAASLPLVTSSVSAMPVRLPAPPRAGAYRLDLRISSSTTGIWNLSGDVSVRYGETARQVVIPARVTSAPLKAQYASGDILPIDITWLPLNKIDAYYSASVRVVDAHGNKIIAQDRQPSLATFLWTPGVPVPDRFLLALPRDLAPGEYSVQVLMYQADLGIDALLLDEQFTPQESIVLGKFEVK